MLAVAAGAVASTKFNADRLKAAASNPALLATEAAELSRAQRHSLPPGARHHRQSAARSREAKYFVDGAASRNSQKISPAFEADFRSSLNLDAALAAKKSSGGTAPECVVPHWPIWIGASQQRKPPKQEPSMTQAKQRTINSSLAAVAETEVLPGPPR